LLGNLCRRNRTQFNTLRLSADSHHRFLFLAAAAGKAKAGFYSMGSFTSEAYL